MRIEGLVGLRRSRVENKLEGMKTISKWRKRSLEQFIHESGCTERGIDYIR